LQKLSPVLKGYFAKIFVGINEEYSSKSDIDVFIDEIQFSVIIRNFVMNSLKYGDQPPDVQQNIIFNLNSDKDFYYLSMVNDGAPFPPEFTLDNFLSFGGRSHKSKGSGLGGFLINRVVQNHNGTIELMDPGTALFLEGLANEPRIIDNSFIKVGVHFLIKLPKE